MQSSRLGLHVIRSFLHYSHHDGAPWPCLDHQTRRNSFHTPQMYLLPHLTMLIYHQLFPLPHCQILTTTAFPNTSPAAQALNVFGPIDILNNLAILLAVVTPSLDPVSTETHMNPNTNCAFIVPTIPKDRACIRTRT
ncbi:hypothetical protein BDZ89DRAFT_833748 [Hymenopellis radicata]|nr:hypothetical protein BDZ89DRAFT_833748 [Hymenopellis radicata]